MGANIHGIYVDLYLSVNKYNTGHTLRQDIVCIRGGWCISWYIFVLYICVHRLIYTISNVTLFIAVGRQEAGH
jgi:hypothetical protein